MAFNRMRRPGALVALVLALVPFTVLARTNLPLPPSAAVAPSKAVPWLYENSDIPPDRAWTFGVLSNGLRYAIRHNRVPPNQVAIRVAIDAGSLMEQDGERGYAHFLEHLSFRGAGEVSGYDVIKVWQRLGATFGSDTNALTSPTQTVYKLDLPSVTPAGLDESLKILSGMMAAPAITPSNVDAERRTVLAELRERNSPQSAARDALYGLFFPGQPIATRVGVAGTQASLEGATPASLTAFHNRWYRPDNTVIVIAGDVDPAAVETLVKRHFTGWTRPETPLPAVDFGRPSAQGPRTAVLTDPGLPATVILGVLRPWVQKADTVEYNRAKMTLGIAARIINRRLETRARAGASYTLAAIDMEDMERSADITMITISPLGGQWETAVADVRAVIADATATPPTQLEIDREAAEFDTALGVAVETEAVEPGSVQADSVVEAVDIRETVASAAVARDVFAGMGARLTPDAVLKATRALFVGTPMRALLISPTPQPGANEQLVRALNAPAKASQRLAAARAVSFADLPPLGPPATVTATATLPLGDQVLKLVRLSNGVRVLLYATDAERGRVRVSARFGRGYAGLPADRPTAAWAGEAVLVPSGVGKLDENDLDQLTSNRAIGMRFDIADDAYVLSGVTRGADLRDQLRLMAAKLDHPRWDPAPVLRLRAIALDAYREEQATPMAVFNRNLMGWMRGGDYRWVKPDRAQIEALTPADVRALFEPILAEGPVELSIYGDMDPDAALKAAIETFGTLKPRQTLEPAAGGLTPSSARPNRSPETFRHFGAADQALGIVAWPTGGGLEAIAEGRRLEVLAAVFSDRLFNRLREADGASYAPMVESLWPERLNSGGDFLVAAPVKPDNIKLFYRVVDDIVADLDRRPVNADELARAVGPIRENMMRISTGNSFWMTALGGITQRPAVLGAVATLNRDYDAITPATLQQTARRWLKRDKRFRLQILPENAPSKP